MAKSTNDTEYGGSTPFKTPALDIRGGIVERGTRRRTLGHGCWLAGKKKGQRLRVKSRAGVRPA